jgi:RNA polymerase sigma-70 factor (ECF subfamily)
MTGPSATTRDFLRFRDHGDAQALARVFDATAPDLLVLAEHLADQPGDAEDLVQTTFVQAMRDAAQFDPQRPVLAWLCGILAHRAADLHRRQRRRRAEPLAADELIARGDLDPAGLASQHELQDLIGSTLERLPADQRRALALRLHHGLDSAEIARVLGHPPATVRSWLHRGLQRLRELLPRSLVAPAVLALPPAPTLERVRDAVLREATSHAPVAATTLGPATVLLAMTKFTATLTVGALALLAILLAWALSSGVPESATGSVPRADPTATAAAVEQRSDGVDERAAGIAPAAARQLVELPADAAAPARIRGRIVRIDADRLPDTPQGRRDPDEQRLPTDGAPPWPGLAIGWIEPGGERFTPITRTDAAGRFELVDDRPDPPRHILVTWRADPITLGAPTAAHAPAALQMRVTPPDGGRPWETVDLGDLPIRAHLEAATVEVVDQAGHGVAGVFVFLAAPPTGHGRLKSFGGINLRTDEGGIARFRGLAPVGDWQLELRDLPNGLAFPGGAKQLARVIRFSAEQSVHRVVLAPVATETTIRGLVVDPGGRPIPRIFVQGWSNTVEHAAWTDASGAFELTGPAEAAIGLIVPPRVAVSTGDDNNRRYEPWRSDRPIAFGTADLRVVLQPRGSLHLEVTDARGRPVETFGYRDIALRPEPDGPAMMAWSELYRAPRLHDEGRATVASLRGDHWLLVVPGDGMGHAPAGYLRYTMPESGSLQLRISLPEPCVGTVRVVDQDGAPVTGSAVELIAHFTEAATTAGDDLLGPIDLDSTLRASHFGRPRKVAGGTTDAGGAVTLSWRADPRDQLSLRVRGDHPETRVHDLRWQAETALQVAVLRGAAQRGRVLPEGVLDALARTHDFTRPPLARNPAERPAARVRLQLEGHSSGPGGAAWVLGAGSDPIRVQDDGRFEIPSLPDGSWRVVAVLDGRPEVRVPVADLALAPGWPRPALVELDLSPLLPSRLQGRVLHPLGADVERLQLQLRAGNWIHVVPLDGLTFDLPGVAPGEYRLGLRVERRDGTQVLLEIAEPLAVPAGVDPWVQDLHFLAPGSGG